MSTFVDQASYLRLAYAAPPRVYDEMIDSFGAFRPHWQAFAAAAGQTSVDEFVRRSAQAEGMLRDNGVTFNVFGDTSQPQRPWRLDLLPVIFATEEWRWLEAGLSQRARLLELIVRDAYGPQQLLKEGALPPEVLFANPGFQRAFHRLDRPGSPSIVLYAAELARAPSGQWRVMADRAEAPVGAAFALENRIVVSRTIPPALHRQPVQRLAQFFLRLQNTLKTLAVQHSDNPRIVLLSAGPKYPYYFEDVYLSRYLGYTLVEGGDLAVRDERVHLKTLAGLVPVDVIVSRGAEGGIDPLELGGAAANGVPGLLHVIRQGNVTIANTPGCGLVESPVFMAFLPRLCQQYLGEELALPSIPTWWCGDANDYRYVQEHLSQLVIKPAFQASGGEEILGERLSVEARSQLLAQITARPYAFVAQEMIERSAAPVWKDGAIGCGHVALRTFLVANATDYSLMPGGLVRMAPTPEPMELSIAAGEGSKDLWVLAEGPVAPLSLLSDDDQPVPLRRTGALFPSRTADDLFWMGRSLDRADFLCRLLRSVIERLTAESNDWPELPVLVRALAEQGQIDPSLFGDRSRTELSTLVEALPRLVADVGEVRGVAFAVSELFRLASLARLWISPDTWGKVHQTATAFLWSSSGPWTGLVDVLTAVDQLIVDLAAVSGLIHDGMIRAPSWRLLDIGRRIERSLDTASLLRATLANGTLHEKNVLKALLEVVDCRMTYRSRYMDNVQQNAVLDLCVTDETNPRSLTSQLLALVEHVDALPRDVTTPLQSEEKRLALEAVHAVRMLTPEQLADPQPDAVEFLLGNMDLQLKLLSDLLTRKYLVHSGAPRQITAEVGLNG